MNILKLILILLLVLGFLFLFSYNYRVKKFISKIKLNKNVKLSVSDEFNLYSYLETKYKNILLPKNIIFLEKDNYFECIDFKFILNNEEKNIYIKFTPLEDNSFITKYIFFDKYGIFEIIENNLNNSDVPEIDHLSSDKSDDLNFDINDIINSETETLNKDISNKEIFLKNIENNDTENDTTESLINNIL